MVQNNYIQDILIDNFLLYATLIVCLFVTSKGFAMNLLHAVRGFVVVTMIFVGNVKADISQQDMAEIFVPVGSFLVDEKRTQDLLGDKLSARNKIILGKALVGGMGHFMKHHEYSRDSSILYFSKSYTSLYFTNNIDPFTEEISVRHYASSVHAAGYVVVNGTLRYAADKYFVNEDYIDKKCDEYLSEDVAWIVKPVAKVAVDLAYDYLTVEILKGIQQGINKSRNS